MVKDLCFEVIEKCLNNCKFCSSRSDCTKEKIINFADFKRVIDYFISTGGIEELSLSGGEPLLHPDIYKMVSYAKSNNIKTVIFTSGVIYGSPLNNNEKETYVNMMNKDLSDIEKHEPYNIFLKNKIKSYYENLIKTPKYSPISKQDLKRLYDLGLDKIVFDYQGYESSTDEYLMGRCEQARQSLLESLYNASQVGLNIDIHFVPMKLNYKEITDILEILEILNIQNISLLNFIPQGRGRDNVNNLLLSKEELNEFFSILESSKLYYSGNIRVGIPLEGEDNHRCNAGLEKLDIKYDGTVLPCPAFKELSVEELKKYNITLPSIYGNLNDIVIPGHGKRQLRLCKQIYK